MSGYRVPPPRNADPVKQAARAEGRSKYLGNPCKNGHIGLRYSSTGGCVECMQFYRDRKAIGQ